MSTMRGILIDPFKRTIESVEFEYEDFQSIAKVIDAEYIEAVRLTRDAPDRKRVQGLDLYVDEEGFINKPWTKQAFFSTSGRTLAGKGLVLGRRHDPENGDDVESLATGIPHIDQLMATLVREFSVIHWLDAKDVVIDAPTFRTPGKAPADLETGGPPRKWTIDDHPAKEEGGV
jgi:hypothetical protein